MLSLLTLRPRAESSLLWSSNALTLSAQPALPTTPALSEASALPAYPTMRSSIRAVKSSAEMALKTGLNNAMMATQTMGMDAHPLVNKKRIICAQVFQALAFCNRFVEMETKNLQQSNVMTPIQVQVTGATQPVNLNMGSTGMLLLTQFIPFVMTAKRLHLRPVMTAIMRSMTAAQPPVQLRQMDIVIPQSVLIFVTSAEIQS